MLGWVAIPPTRIGTALDDARPRCSGIVWRWSHRSAWDQPHVLALASGAVIAAGCFDFLTTPIGEVSLTQKYGHNFALLASVALLSPLAARRTRPRLT
jgi:hypothetical protein